MPSPDLIPAHGGFHSLKSYQNAEIIYEALAIGTPVLYAGRHEPPPAETHS
jgi:hypothetical protein